MSPTRPVDGVMVVAATQAGIVTRAQVLGSGRTARYISARVNGGRWARVYPGVYATFTGPLPRCSRLWAALLACGDGAVLSGLTALEVNGVVEESSIIEIAIPAGRRVKAPEGTRVRRSERLERARHPVALPPRTRVEEAVLDVVDGAPSPEAVIDVITRACQRRRTTAERLHAALDERGKLRWRSLAECVLTDVGEGAHSALERRYLRTVEQAHGLPRGQRNRPEAFGGRRFYRDVCYRLYRLVVELDGRAAHPAKEREHDHRRDNQLAMRGVLTLRFGWQSVAAQPCQVAAAVAAALWDSGWPGFTRPCGPRCQISQA